mmetsp:Transcript_52319/g.131514  ORF Transcript_52319/g.131514 Transcript_52319/m.131514 type:complete len:203 (+) Transcript_52319:312-920(+)
MPSACLPACQSSQHMLDGWTIHSLICWLMHCIPSLSFSLGRTDVQKQHHSTDASGGHPIPRNHCLPFLALAYREKHGRHQTYTHTPISVSICVWRARLKRGSLCAPLISSLTENTSPRHDTTHDKSSTDADPIHTLTYIHTYIRSVCTRRIQSEKRVRWTTESVSGGLVMSGHRSHSFFPSLGCSAHGSIAKTAAPSFASST